ncbi:unnamed protein product [Cercospora beticola]|nr:unnamed protein product [Cercospora beticola]
MALTLDSLPDELAGLIIDFLSNDSDALFNVAVTASRYQALAESVLWRRLFIQTGQGCKRILQALKTRRERATAIHEIELRATPREEIGLQKFHKILSLTHNLRDLIIESPTCNHRQWSKDGNWPIIKQDIEALLLRSGSNVPSTVGAAQPPLQLLKRLTIHSNGEKTRYWSSMAIFPGLFLHPCLEELTISCVNFDLGYENFPACQKVTPLKRLTLIECNVHSRALLAILSLPRALEHLYLGENRDHQWERSHLPCNDLLSDDEDEFFEALTQQACSLKTFAYRPRKPEKLTAFSGRHCFSAMQVLESVSIHGKLGTSNTLEASILSTSPNLQTLVLELDLDTHSERTFDSLAWVTDAESISNSVFSHLAKCVATSSTLRNVRVVVSSYRPPSDFHSPHMIAVIDSFTRSVRTKDIRVTILYEVRRGWTTIPPYLYDEREPVQHVIFDSADSGWTANIDGIGHISEDERRWLEAERQEALDTEDVLNELNNELDDLNDLIELDE